jgi:hypothetical protein
MIIIVAAIPRKAVTKPSFDIPEWRAHSVFPSAASEFQGIAPRVRDSRGGCSFQFGRASAPTMPQRVQTMRELNVGSTTSSHYWSRFSGVTFSAPLGSEAAVSPGFRFKTVMSSRDDIRSNA